MNESMSRLAKSFDSEGDPVIERLCREGNTSVADSLVNPFNAAAMNGSSKVGMYRLFTAVKE
jgi:hypothetical protein